MNWTETLPRIVHADDTLVVVDKPAGMPAVPGRPQALHDCASARVQRRFADACIVHRLDMATSGLLLFARGTAMQRALGDAFAGRRVDKRYVAVVHGRLDAGAGTIDLPLAADWPNRPRQRVDAGRGKAATTHWRLLAYDAATDRSRVELQPVTGRSHQLRVHLMAIGHPIAGDALYAPPALLRGAERLLLHAERLAFDHPLDARARVFEAPAPF